MRDGDLPRRAGARVALIEKRPDPTAFKRVCGHFIQSSAMPTLQRLGLLQAIEGAGGLRSRVRLWTRWGWIEPDEETLPSSINLRREFSTRSCARRPRRRLGWI